MSGKEINLTQQSSYKTSPKWSISARIPPREAKKGMPGPGAYGNTNSETDKWKSTPKITMAGGQRDSKEWGSFPGPGQYAPPMGGKTSSSFGFGSETRLHEIKRSRTPGPGAYETRGNLEGLHFSVASRPEGSSKFSVTPAPGAYKPNYDQVYEAPPKMSFGGSSRSDLLPSKTPGPGQYEAITILGGNCAMRSPPRFTIIGKRSQAATEQSPGPGPTATQFSR